VFLKKEANRCIVMRIVTLFFFGIPAAIFFYFVLAGN